MEQMKENDRIRVAMNCMGSGLIATDIKGSITFMNPTAEAITGFSKEEAFGKALESIFRIVDDRERANVRQFIKYMNTEVLTIKTNILTADNSSKTIISSLTSIINDFNEFIGVVLVFEDITGNAEIAATIDIPVIDDLHHAIKRGELLLHYQPKIDVRTGELTGMEALVRWQHPKKGLLYPNDFIPHAEETGMIKELDEWVLRTGCNQLKHWNELGYKNIRLSVNLSAWQFRYRNLPETVAAVLEETGIDPSCLELEITETVAIENMKSAVNTLSKIIEMGVNISIDDFGTGYSSLNYLKHFPINYLKIDQTFIADIVENKNTCSIVKAIIDIAHSLNLKVIAEGVETKEQLSVLQRLGCDEIQGFYVCKPLPVMDAENHMKKNLK
jgi:PAS domain S-box-containing protein